MRFLIIIISLMVFLQGCHKEVKPDSKTIAVRKIHRPYNPEKPDKLPKKEQDGQGKKDKCNPAPIYFDFDKSDIRPGMVRVAENNALCIMQNGEGLKVLEGHADERGTAEYNLALGERRAVAVREFLTNMGIDPGSLQVVSYGEERPTGQGYDADRRVEIK